MGLPSRIPYGTLPSRWEDGSYSVQGAANAIGVSPGTIYKWLKTERINGEQTRKGTPWRIFLSDREIEDQGVSIRAYGSRDSNTLTNDELINKFNELNEEKMPKELR